MSISPETRARDDICRVGRSLFERGYVHGSAGNISVRLPDGSFLITPTDACLGFLEPQQLALVDEAWHQVSGAPASKTLQLHRRIYASVRAHEPGVGCVIHTHSHHCVALSLARPGQSELLPEALTPYFLMKVGRVPLVPYQRPGHPDVAEAVASTVQAWAARGVVLRGVMLERLGPNVWHRDPLSAMAVLEELEATARLVLTAMPSGFRQPEALTDADISDLRRSFDVRW